MAKFLQ